ncbi:MAG TPA: hypothetical protein V6D19_16670 [Stenomitos sp.]
MLLVPLGVAMGLGNFDASAQTLLPPSDDIPEEMLQVQAPLQFHSPQSGLPQSPNAYAQEQQQLRIAPQDVPAQLAPEVQQAAELLRIRKVLKVFLPFL